VDFERSFFLLVMIVWFMAELIRLPFFFFLMSQNTCVYLIAAGLKGNTIVSSLASEKVMRSIECMD
jgi:hypothetical protein